MRDPSRSACLLWVGLLCVCLSACGLGTEAGPKGVLLITIDTLRADHLSSYGYPRKTSPTLDRVAREGVLFTDLVAPRGQTWPSIASLFTSLHPRRHGVRGNGYLLDASLPTLSGLLQDAGYATAGFVTNMLYARHPGFDHLSRIQQGDDVDAQAITEAVDWLRGNQDERFLLWLHLTGPHDPYRPAPEYARRFATGHPGPPGGRSKALARIHRDRSDVSPEALAHVISLYDAEIAQVDDRIGGFLGEVERLGLSETTLVVLASDHGDALYEHDHYFFHALSIHESVLHVPLILKFPGLLPAGAKVEGVVRMMDVAPTILELLGEPVPPVFEGSSLVPRIRNEEDGDAVVAFSELGPHVHSVRTPRWHFISNPDGVTSTATQVGDDGDGGEFQLDPEALYDIQADPKETLNLLARHPEVASRLRARLARWRGEREDSFEKLAPVGEVLEELRAMGYVE